MFVPYMDTFCILIFGWEDFGKLKSIRQNSIANTFDFGAKIINNQGV